LVLIESYCVLTPKNKIPSVSVTRRRRLFLFFYLFYIIFLNWLVFSFVLYNGYWAGFCPTKKIITKIVFHVLVELYLTSMSLFQIPILWYVCTLNQPSRFTHHSFRFYNHDVKKNPYSALTLKLHTSLGPLQTAH